MLFSKKNKRNTLDMNTPLTESMNYGWGEYV